jgi:hypothetical protein
VLQRCRSIAHVWLCGRRFEDFHARECFFQSSMCPVDLPNMEKDHHAAVQGQMYCTWIDLETFMCPPFPTLIRWFAKCGLRTLHVRGMEASPRASKRRPCSAEASEAPQPRIRRTCKKGSRSSRKGWCRCAQVIH